MNPVQYFTQRRREIREWWLLHKKDPDALYRQQQRNAQAMSGQPAGLSDELPAPRGPRLVEVGAIVGVLLIIAVIGSLGGPPPAQDSASAQSSTTALGARPSSTVSADADHTGPRDLESVPVGQSQKISGSTKKDGSFSATVTVESVVRTSDDDLVVHVAVRDVEGMLPMNGSAWKIVSQSGREISMNLYGDNALGTRLRDDADGTVSASVPSDTVLRTIRFQPPSGGFFTPDTNDTAVWTVGAITTSLTPTPSYPTAVPDDGAGSGDGSGSVDLPHINPPNVHVPSPCINGRDRRGRFC